MPTPEPPFSNGTEADAWMENWCHRCMVDAPFRNTGKGSGCPLLIIAYCGETPDEWIEHEKFSLGDRYHCINFKPPGWRDPEPRPKPDPQHDGLFDTPERGTRMLLPLVESKPPTDVELELREAASR